MQTPEGERAKRLVTRFPFPCKSPPARCAEEYHKLMHPAMGRTPPVASPIGGRDRPFGGTIGPQTCWSTCMAASEDSGRTPPSQPGSIPLVASDTRSAPQVVSSRKLSVATGSRRVVLMIDQIGSPELRLLLSFHNALELARQLIAAAVRLRRSRGHG